MKTQPAHPLRRWCLPVWEQIALAAVLSLLTTISTGLAAGRNPNPGVLPSQSSAYGATYGEWAATWWQWALGIPTDQNPLIDPTGQFGALGQSGKVWFLAGNCNPGNFNRKITVPTGCALFLALANTAWVSTPGDPAWDAPYSEDGITYPTYEQYVRQTQLKPVIDAVTGLACVLDGQVLRNLETYRTQAPSFMVTLPAGNIYDIDAGEYGPAADDGIYLLLAPLSAGHHTLFFAATLDLGDGSAITMETTYRIRVK